MPVKVKWNEFVGPCESPIWAETVAEQTCIHVDKIKAVAKELGLPPHYHRVSVPGKTWCKKYLRVFYPSEVALIRLVVKPEFGAEVDLPDWLWGARRPQGATLGPGGISGGDARTIGTTIYPEESGAFGGRHDGDREVHGEDYGHDDAAGPSGAVGSLEGAGRHSGDQSPTGPSSGDDCPQSGTPQLDVS